MNEARFWICWGLSLPGRPIAEPMPALRSEHFATSFFVFLSVIGMRHGVAKTASGGPKQSTTTSPANKAHAAVLVAPRS